METNPLFEDISLTNFNFSEIPLKCYKEVMDKVDDYIFTKIANGEITFRNGMENQTHNRYYNTIPQDQTLVTNAGVYINANIVDNNIITQGPLRYTITDFWKMIIANNIEYIVMLTEISKEKCEQYWGWEDEFFKAEFKIMKQTPTYTIRKLLVLDRHNGITRTILHFQYEKWEDHGTPELNNFIEFLDEVYHFARGGRFVIHCSAGIGRSGVFAFIDYVKRRNMSTINVFNILKKLRVQRVKLIQTSSQLKFTLESLSHLKKRSISF